MTFIHTEIHYPGDIGPLASLGPERRAAFEDWMKRLDAEHERRGFPYGKEHLRIATGLECWLSWFLDGDDPADALAEDLSNAD